MFCYRVVTPHSRLRFRILDHSTFRKDAVIGQKSIGLYDILQYYNGKLENLELTLELIPERSLSFVPISVGKLIVFFNDLNVNLQSVLPPHFSSPGECSRVDHQCGMELPKLSVFLVFNETFV